jgi:hypothetical protein
MCVTYLCIRLFIYTFIAFWIISIVLIDLSHNVNINSFRFNNHILLKKIYILKQPFIKGVITFLSR